MSIFYDILTVSHFKRYSLLINSILMFMNTLALVDSEITWVIHWIIEALDDLMNSLGFISSLMLMLLERLLYNFDLVMDCTYLIILFISFYYYFHLNYLMFLLQIDFCIYGVFFQFSINQFFLQFFSSKNNRYSVYLNNLE